MQIFTGCTPFWEIAQGPQYCTAHRIATEVVLGRRPLKPTPGTDPYCRYGLTDDIWSMMQDCWAPEVRLRPTVHDLLERPFLSNLTDPRPSNLTDSL